MADFSHVLQLMTPTPSSRSVAAKALDILVNNRAQPEKWQLRRPNSDGKPPSAKKQKTNDIPSAVTFEDTILAPTNSKNGLTVASFLDPHDFPNLILTCKAAHETLSKSTETHLQACFRYFSVLQNYADQLEKLRYSGKELVRFLTRLAETLQQIYGPDYAVHPIHRALVAERILNELCGVHYYEDGDEDDPLLSYDNPDRPLFHPRAPKRQLSENLFFTKFSRFSWQVVLGDHYYSFARSDALEYGHGDDWIDLGIREDMVEEQGYVLLFMYQDEDNFRTQRMSKQGGNQRLFIGTKYQSLAHCFVFEARKGGAGCLAEEDYGEDSEDCEADPNDNPKLHQDIVLDRMHWLYQRKLVEGMKEEDWKALVGASQKKESDFKTYPLAVVRPGSFPTRQAPKQSAKGEVKDDDNDTPLTTHEQEKLTEAINGLSGDRIAGVVQIIRESIPNKGEKEDEIDLEIDRLDAPTQRRLLEFVFGDKPVPGQIRGKGLLKRPK